jgi:cytochrome c peroxidase
MFRKVLVAATVLLAAPASADTPESLMRGYAEQARTTSASYAGPSPAAGGRLFHQQPRDWSCATCHTDQPVATGRHAITGKTIAPLSPVANPERFRDAAKVEKWFKRNCTDTLGRLCTSAEKADLISFLLSAQGGT